MKGILVLIDGLGDLPNPKLGNKTPLDVAKSPNLDYMAYKGKLGYMYPVKERFIPGTSEAISSIFGQEWQEYPRGWLESLGAGIELKHGDLALRVNFATIDNLDSRRILDRRAGRNLTTKEAKILSDALNREVKIPAKFIFQPTLQHRAVLVFRGGFSDNISPTDPEYLFKYKKKDDKFRFSIPEDDDELSIYTANMLNNFLEQAFHILNKHPINENRRKKGFLPANIILARSPGISIDRTNKFNNWTCTTSVPVIKGICKVLGINLFEFGAVDFKGDDVYLNLKENLVLEIRKAVKLVKKKQKEFDFFFIYLKETDSPGHDNKPIEKKEMIEIIDKKLFSFLRKFEKNKIKIIVTGDHSTPCKLKTHSSDSVPVLLCDWEGKKEKKFSEKEARKGELGKMYGKELLKLFS